MDRTEQIFYHSTIRLESGILQLKLSRDLVVTEEVAKEIISDRKNTFGTMEYPMFIDINELLSIDVQAQKYMAGEAAWEYITAGAIFTNNKVLDALCSTWLLIHKPTLPIKIFSSRKSALDWLQQYKPTIEH
jgi:hypothetical protein